MSEIIMKIPVSAAINKYSAIVSNWISFLGFFALKEKKENIHEAINNKAIKEVISSMILEAE